MSRTTMYETETLVVHSCPTCGVMHAIPRSLERQALDNRGEHGKCIYCPNGHVWFFTGQNEEERLRKRLANVEEDVRSARADAEVERNRARSYKGHVTRLKNRVGKGRCPACSVEFPNLAEHMEHEHPGYADE